MKTKRTVLSLIAVAVMGLLISGCSFAQQLDDVTRELSAEGEVSAAQLSSDLTEFDLSNNGLIDDDEFFRVLDMWISERVSDQQFFEVIDAWSSQAALDNVEQKSDTPDWSRIHAFRNLQPSDNFVVMGMSGAVEPMTHVIVRDEFGNVGLTIAEADGSFRFSSFDLPDGFDKSIGGKLEVTQREDGKRTSNSAVITIQFSS